MLRSPKHQEILQFKLAWISYSITEMQALLLIMDPVSSQFIPLGTWNTRRKILMIYCLAGVFGATGITRLTTQVTTTAQLGVNDVV